VEAIESEGKVTAESFAIEVAAGDEVVARSLRVDSWEGPVRAIIYPGCRGKAAGDEQPDNYVSSTHVLERANQNTAILACLPADPAREEYKRFRSDNFGTPNAWMLIMGTKSVPGETKLTK
jgi:hypothetical protein